MIVELFGLPTSGKTTLATRLVARLTEAGIESRLVTAREPAQIARILQRLSKLRAMLCAFTFMPGSADAAWDLLVLFPQRDRLRTIRLWQYLIQMRELYASAAERAEVLVLDQGFLQALYSVAALSTSCSNESLAAALDKVPRSDLLVALDTSPAIIAERLRICRSHGQLADALARDKTALSASVELSDRIRRVAEARGWCMITADVPETLDQVVARVAQRLREDAGGAAADPTTPAPDVVPPAAERFWPSRGLRSSH